MRPVRFVALSEDGQALVLADEVGRLLSLPIDGSVSAAVRHDPGAVRGQATGSTEAAALSPRDIQSRIRSGESAEEVARIAGVPVDRVLRYAGPVLQERAMLAQHARRTRLRSSDRGATLAEIVDARLHQHGVDAEGVSWDAHRREDGTWRIVASWASGKATAQAMWALDKARQVVTPDDDMAHFLSTERPAPLLGQDPEPASAGPVHRTSAPSRGTGRSGGHALTRPEDDMGRPRPGSALPEHGSGRGGHGLPSTGQPPRRRAEPAARTALDRPLADPIRPGADAPRPKAEPLTRDPLPDEGMPREPRPAVDLPGLPPRPDGEPARPAAEAPRRTASVEPLRPTGRMSEPTRSTEDLRSTGFTEDERESRDMPVVPSLAVLRPRRTEQGATGERSRLPSWDDVLFGNGNTSRP